MQSAVLYQLVAEHLESFLEVARESTGRGLPSHVERELRGLLGLRHPRLRIPAGALR
jgi:hypothetical protein